MYKNVTRYDQQKLSAVWSKGAVIFGVDPNIARKDRCGATIYWREHGNRDSRFGWEVDHITPESHGGSDNLANLQPLHWRNNVAKGDGPLRCEVRV